MKPIDQEAVQQWLDHFINKNVYVHAETTNGAYASSHGRDGINVGVYLRNVQVSFSQAKITTSNEQSYRIGLKTELGWLYTEGLTDWTIHQETKLLLAGHDPEGRVIVALQISEQPFIYE
ncbi:MAG TPA: YojF family protein [Bacillota bacterium]|nr:YojF family protein [Bacillota bacterium]